MNIALSSTTEKQLLVKRVFCAGFFSSAHILILVFSDTEIPWLTSNIFMQKKVNVRKSCAFHSTYLNIC